MYCSKKAADYTCTDSDVMVLNFFVIVTMLNIQCKGFYKTKRNQSMLLSFKIEGGEYNKQ